MVPLSYDILDHSALFSTTECREGIVATSKDSLRIITLEKLGEMLNQQVVQLRYSPRKMVIHEKTHNLIIIESDNKVYCESEKNALISKYYAQNEDLAT